LRDAGEIFFGIKARPAFNGGVRVYTKYRRTPMRKAQGGRDRFHWVLVVFLAAFLVWLWWNNLQKPPRTSVPDQIERPQPAVNRKAARSGEVVTLTVSRPVAPETRESAAFNPHPPRNDYEVQVALARQALSPGSIDGAMGSQTRAALRAFQLKQGLPLTGMLDADTKAQLVINSPPERDYIVTEADLARLGPVGRTWLAKSLQDRLEYETILELVAEKSMAQPNLVRMLNPAVDWNNVLPGTILRVPDASYPPARAKAAFVRIRLSARTLQVFDRSTNLMAHFPCSIARRVEKRPLGRLQVESIALHPNYRFSPEIFPESEEARQLKRPLMIPPGPNNPVGTAWIGLDRSSYGIHGTPRPEDVGRTESHGCFRLANWNAEFLALLVEVGTPVYVEP
jgi:lipoprotein-anchoring transpeptidase ErfK/SrfK